MSSACRVLLERAAAVGEDGANGSSIALGDAADHASYVATAFAAGFDVFGNDGFNVMFD